MLTRRSVLVTATSAVFAGALRPAAAQSGYPTHPIRILVGYPAGGGVDIVARLLGEPMKQALGQTVIVENRTGAAGMIAAGTVAKATPDGLTLLMAASGEVAINQHLYKDKMTYDPARELAPVALVTGLAAGFFGVGGGFLIAPGLMASTGMTLANAGASSLLSVTLFGAATSASYAASGLVSWPLFGALVVGGAIGTLAAMPLSRRLAAQPRTARSAFAVMVIAVAAYILFHAR